MKTLIAYATKHGTTEKIAKILSKKLNGDIELCNLKKEKNIELDRYDKVIIGSSVYMGKVRKEAATFCTEKLSDLRGKKVGLYISCMKEGDEAVQELNDNFPDDLAGSAAARGVFGGEFNFEKMNFMERMIVKKVAGIEETQSNISEEDINKFVELFAGA